MSKNDPILLDLMLIGKTGVGKSACGNSILQRDVFTISNRGTSETAVVKCEWANHSGYRIKVIDTPAIFDTEKRKEGDTPGVSDTGKGKEETDKEAAVRNMSKGIGLCPSGVHAFLLVMNPFDRDTKESVETIELLKTILSDDAVKNHSIIVITHGDGLCMKDTESFEEWCKQQGGERGKLFKECNYRCVLFYNNAKYESERQQSVQNLLSKVVQMTESTGLYTHGKFDKLAAVREKMIIEEKVPELSEELQMKMSLLSADVEKCSEDSSEIHVGQLLERTKQFRDQIDKLVKKSEVFQKLEPQILSIEQNVNDIIQTIRDKKKGLLTVEKYKQMIGDQIIATLENIRETRKPYNSATWKSYFRTCALTIGGVAVVGGAAAAGVVAAPALAATAATGAALGATVGGAGVIGGGLASIAFKMKRS